MGLDFGLVKMNKNDYASYNGDKEAFYADENKVVVDLVNFCGWDNPTEKWFKHGFKYYYEYDGYLMRSLDANDIYAAMSEAINWYNNCVHLSYAYPNRAFRDKDDEYTEIFKIDGIELNLPDDNSIRHIHKDDTYGRLFITSEFVDPEHLNIYMYFMEEMIKILKTTNWDTEVLLYYVSY